LTDDAIKRTAKHTPIMTSLTQNFKSKLNFLNSELQDFTSL